MAKEYIKREAALTELEDIGFYDDEPIQVRNRALKIIKNIPAADVRPVVRGEWVISRTDYGWNSAEFPTHCKCSRCGREVPYQDKDNFCPNCGADMREVDDD